jgi:hypothetical protein
MLSAFVFMLFPYAFLCISSFLGEPSVIIMLLDELPSVATIISSLSLVVGELLIMATVDYEPLGFIVIAY